MFSGIIEAKAPIVKATNRDEVVEIRLQRPILFSDIKIGDSIAVNGICLTLEKFENDWMQFAIGYETLKLTSWTAESLVNKEVNLERSLKLGDRIHGHMVSGHVEALGEVIERQTQGENFLLNIHYPKTLKPYIWKKGSITLQGVSLTVNDLSDTCFSVCLIPETLEKTNLKNLDIGEKVNLEADYFAKALHHFWQVQNASN